MNTRYFVALALSASLFGFAAHSAKAADGVLMHFAGNWAGNGKITVDNGSSERIRCRANNKSDGKSLSLSLRCASDSYKFELASDIASNGDNISGSWNETTRGVFGTLSGKATQGNIQATASAVGFSAAMSLRQSGSSLNVSIKSPGSEISEVVVVLAKSGAK